MSNDTAPHSQPANDQPKPHDLLITGASLVVTMDDADTEHPGGWVAITDGVISGIGAAGTEPTEAAATLDARGGLVTPGLINTHHHTFQNLTRSSPESLTGDFFDWLTHLFPMFARLDAESVFLSTYVGMAELALGGCTTTADHMYVHPKPGLVDAAIAAAQEFGMRFHPVRGSMNLGDAAGGLPPEAIIETQAQILADCRRLVEAHHDPSPQSMVQIAFGPCSVYTVTPELMRETAALADELNVRLHTHLAEDPLDVDFCIDTMGKRPIEHFAELWWASDRTWVAHCVYANDTEIRMLAERGVSVAHCPSALMVLGGDAEHLPPVRELLDAGVNVSIGVDGSSSADTASMWLETRNAMMLARLKEGRATRMTAREALRMATRGGAHSLGRDSEIGQLRIGAAGDLVVWPTNELAFAGAIADPVVALLQCGPATARHTVIAGKAVIMNGKPTASGFDSRFAAHREAAKRVQGR